MALFEPLMGRLSSLFYAREVLLAWQVHVRLISVDHYYCMILSWKVYSYREQGFAGQVSIGSPVSDDKNTPSPVSDATGPR